MRPESPPVAVGAAPPSGLYESRFKRFVDLSLAIPLTVLSAPFAIVTALLIRADDRGPAIFRQERVGRGGAIFIFRKFRTMPVDTASVPSADAGALHVTRVGKVLRRTSLDEIPQILSVLKGEMSLVGPRAPLPAQSNLVDLRRANESLRLRPGLTGLAQVNAFDGMSDEGKAAWDGLYVRTIGFGTDLRIMLRTFGYLLRKPPQY